MLPLAIKVDDVARISGLSASYLNQLRVHQPEKSPPFFREGRRVLYPIGGVSEWIKGRTEATQAELGIAR